MAIQFQGNCSIACNALSILLNGYMMSWKPLFRLQGGGYSLIYLKLNFYCLAMEIDIRFFIVFFFPCFNTLWFHLFLFT